MKQHLKSEIIADSESLNPDLFEEMVAGLQEDESPDSPDVIEHPEDIENQVNGPPIIPVERGKILYSMFNVK